MSVCTVVHQSIYSSIIHLLYLLLPAPKYHRAKEALHTGQVNNLFKKYFGCHWKLAAQSIVAWIIFPLALQ